MPSEVGSTIYKLKKKNKQLLEQLELNSSLLEKKIKMLRHAASSTEKNFNAKDASPLKRKRTSWNSRNNSSRIAAALIKQQVAQNHIQLEEVSSDLENDPEKKSGPCNKILRAKPSRERSVMHLKSEVSGACEKQSKPKRKIIDKNFQKKSKMLCYCRGICKHSTHAPDRQEKSQTSTKTRGECKNNTKHLKNFKSSSLHGNKVAFLNQHEDQACTTSLKTVHDMHRLLCYSPESEFLRRMKQRVLKQNLENDSTNESSLRINKSCNCESKDALSVGSQSDYSCKKSTVCACREHTNSGYMNENNENEIFCNTNDKSCDNHSKKHASEQKEDKPLKIGESSQHIIETQTGASETSAPTLGKICDCMVNKEIQTDENKFYKNTLYKHCSKDCTRSKKCCCMKKVGGLCCCELASYSNQEYSKQSVKCSAHTVKTSASAPTICHVKSNELFENNCTSIGAHEKETSQQRGRGETQLGKIRDDAGCNKWKNLTKDPCTYHLEELSNYRKKHWFDCHSHPHDASPTDVCRVPNELHIPIDTFHNDLMQPTAEPCVRLYCLNDRCFPEEVDDKHSAQCCVSRQGGCITPLLPPSQRRLVTLPTVPHSKTNKNCKTIKPTPAIRSFPGSSFLVCEPPSPRESQSRPQTSRNFRQVIPSNSLALRFQKGVYQATTSVI